MSVDECALHHELSPPAATAATALDPHSSHSFAILIEAAVIYRRLIVFITHGANAAIIQIINISGDILYDRVGPALSRRKLTQRGRGMRAVHDWNIRKASESKRREAEKRTKGEERKIDEAHNKQPQSQYLEKGKVRKSKRIEDYTLLTGILAAPTRPNHCSSS